MLVSHKLQRSGPLENHSHLRFHLEDEFVMHTSSTLQSCHVFTMSYDTRILIVTTHNTGLYFSKVLKGRRKFGAVLKHHSLIDWKSGSFEKQPTTKVKVRNQQPTRINQHHHCSNRYLFFGERNLAPLSRDLIQLLERSSQEVDPWCHGVIVAEDKDLKIS